MTLTVGKLKEILSKFDDNTKVITISDNYELRGSYVDARVSEIKTVKATESFRDDFDGDRYSKEVYHYAFDDDKKAETVVKISG